MKYTFAFIVLWAMMFMATSTIAQTTEPVPEPTQPTIEYKFQIGYGTIIGVEWVDLPNVKYEVVEGLVSNDHNYWSLPGIQKWEAISCDDPKMKVVFSFELSPKQGPPIFLYRVRLAGYTVEPASQGPWSEASEWVGIITIPQPGRPIMPK